MNMFVQCHKGAIEYVLQFVLFSYKLMADPYRFADNYHEFTSPK